MWYRKKLAELNVEDFYQILKLRIDTFVVEQERIYHELDDKDLAALHIFHKNASGQVDAYARLFEENEHLVFGRVVTVQAARGQGLGGRLIEQILEEAARESKDIHIEAQEQVVALYEKYGFEAVGEPFIFESTPHLAMIYQQKTKK